LFLLGRGGASKGKSLRLFIVMGEATDAFELVPLFELDGFALIVFLVRIFQTQVLCLVLDEHLIFVLLSIEVRLL